MQQTYVRVSHWLEPSETAAELIIWPLDAGAPRHEELRGRLALTIEIGAATVHLEPTAAEARALIAALQDALDHPAPQTLAEAA